MATNSSILAWRGPHGQYEGQINSYSLVYLLVYNFNHVQVYGLTTTVKIQNGSFTSRMLTVMLL